MNPGLRTRGWLPVVIACVAAVITIGGTAVLAGRTAVEATTPAVADGPTSSQQIEAWVMELGIVLNAKVTFAEDVTLTDPILRMGEIEAEGELWPLDGHDHEGEDLDPLRLPTGTPVLIQGLIRPLCDGNDAKVSLSVSSENFAGETVVNHYTARNPGDLVFATRQYCDQGPTVTAGMNRLSPDGDAVIGITVVNPGPADITIEVPPYSDENVTWTALTGEVPAGEQVRFEIYGTQVGCELGEIASWQDGRLLIDGEPFVVASDDAWC